MLQAANRKVHRYAEAMPRPREEAGILESSYEMLTSQLNPWTAILVGDLVIILRGRNRAREAVLHVGCCRRLIGDLLQFIQVGSFLFLGLVQ